MAVYKVIQDIEAEDKILGPLTLKGFIYAAISGLLIFIDVRLWIGGVSTMVKIIFTFIFLPPTALFVTLASPLGREQPTEVWLLSRIRFLFKPHTRRWDQMGIKELVRVTAPKKPEHVYTKNISQTEVASRLQSLSNMLDSRGWAIKDSNVNLAQPGEINKLDASDDRLEGATTLKEDEPVLGIRPGDDILDGQSNPTAQNVDTLMANAEADRRESMKIHMEEIIKNAQAQPTLPAKAAARKLLPLTSTKQTSQAAKMELAKSGLSVATVAKLANRPNKNEVTINLH